ncbi:MAG: PQQ-binding-like beta-propeller repeat protein [Planctomycetota bacterium]|nr:PQQ-binding-like beta-propeller repeat protein [Planctomycetota bacterium]
MVNVRASHVALLALTLATVSFAAPPVGWRNDGTGKFLAATPPINWATDSNIVWRIETSGRSLASPVVVGNQVFVTAEPAELLCFSTKDGKQLWQQSHQYIEVFGKTEGDRIEKDLAQARDLGKQVNDLQRERDAARKAENLDQAKELEGRINSLRERINKLQVFPPMPGGDTGNTGSTPTSDGKNIFAVFGTGIVASHALAGKRNWIKFVEAPSNGHCASPILIDGKLIVHLRNLIALDAETGAVLWKAETGARHGSPVAAQIDGTSIVVTPEGAVVRVSDGKIVAKNQFRLNHSSPIVHAGVVYAMQEGSIKAVTLANAAADQAVTQVAWETSGSRASRLASPVYHDGLVYSVTEQGILEVTAANTGDRVYRMRLKFDGGRVDPSVVLAGNHLYVSNTRGETVVFRPGKEYEEVARCHLKDGFSSSLTFAGRRLYVRTKKYFYCIEEPDTVRGK